MEDDTILSKVVFGGEFLLDFEDHVILLKTPATIAAVVEYLRETPLEPTIGENMQKIDDPDYPLPKDDTALEFLLGYSEGILSFYEKAKAEGRNVIFTVDL